MDDSNSWLEKPRERQALHKSMSDRRNGIKTEGIARRVPKGLPKWDELDVVDQGEIAWYLMNTTIKGRFSPQMKKTHRCSLIGENVRHLTQPEARRYALKMWGSYKKLCDAEDGIRGVDKKYLAPTKYFR